MDYAEYDMAYRHLVMQGMDPNEAAVEAAEMVNFYGDDDLD